MIPFDEANKKIFEDPKKTADAFREGRGIKFFRADIVPPYNIKKVTLVVEGQHMTKYGSVIIQLGNIKNTTKVET